MERTVKILTLALAIGATTELHAQDDFCLWGEVNVEKKIDKRWSAGAGFEFRSRDDVKEADRWSVGADISYKICDFLKVSAGYTLLDDHRQKLNNSGKKYSDYWGLRHRFNVSLTGSYDIGDLSISLRERWQYTYRPEKEAYRYWNYTDDDESRYYGEVADLDDDGNPVNNVFSGKAKHVWRNRLQMKYKLTKMWRPYASAETYVSKGLDKIRYAVGTEIRLTKQHSFDAKYMYQNTSDDDEEGNRHIISIGYTYKF